MCLYIYIYKGLIRIKVYRGVSRDCSIDRFRDHNIDRGLIGILWGCCRNVTPQMDNQMQKTNMI